MGYPAIAREALRDIAYGYSRSDANSDGLLSYEEIEKIVQTLDETIGKLNATTRNPRSSFKEKQAAWKHLREAKTLKAIIEVSVLAKMKPGETARYLNRVAYKPLGALSERARELVLLADRSADRDGVLETSDLDRIYTDTAARMFGRD